ncbi:MAG: hypothetical protein J5641_03990 [Bacteroidales bacterium]|nr:hypothetical protein [Bacteroidales bacterium]
MKHRLFLLLAVATFALASCEKEMEVYPRCFSVSETKQVFFSPGNLQYMVALNKYQFAPTQLDVIGNSNNQISPTYSGSIDLFGWGTGSNPTMSVEDGNMYPSFDDWGKHLEEAGWRTLTHEEWNYLLQKRPNANKLYGTCTVQDANFGNHRGLVILPDKWNCDTIEVSYTGEYNQHLYDIDHWRLMEKAGAIFLPAAGNRMGKSVKGVGEYGRYWSSSPTPMGCAFFMGFLRSDVDDGTLRSNGRSVRLVKDITSPSQIPAN